MPSLKDMAKAAAVLWAVVYAIRYLRASSPTANVIFPVASAATPTNQTNMNYTA